MLECIAGLAGPVGARACGDLTHLSEMPVEMKQLRPVGRAWPG